MLTDLRESCCLHLLFTIELGLSLRKHYNVLLRHDWRR